MIKKYFLFLVVTLFLGTLFFLIPKSAFASCITYTQPNQCTVPPDIGHDSLYIVDKCGSSNFTYSCFSNTTTSTSFYYTQPDQCTAGPYGPTGINKGHLYLVKKEGNTFYCVTDCTRYPSMPHCPAPAQPTPTSTNNSPTPTHGVSPTPTGTIATTGDVTVHLEGIDKANFQNDENIIPTKESQGSSKTRTVTLYFYESTAHPETDNPMFVKSDTVTQITDSKSDYFGNFRQANFKLPGVTNGTYIVLVKVQEGSLIEYLNGSQSPIQIYNQGGNNVLVNVDNVDLSSYKLTYNPSTTPPAMRMGDILTKCTDAATCDFNTISPFDYSALVDCYGGKISSNACKAHNYPGDQNNMFNGKQYFVADLNGDGVVDGIDYTMLLKNYNITGVNVNLASAKIKASVPVQPTPAPSN